MTQAEALELVERLAQTTIEGRQEALALLSQATEESIKLSGRGLDLSEADLSNGSLRGANLRRATLNRANLHGTDLREADLGEVTMVCPGMERTNLSGASLRGAYVHALAMQTVTMDGADLSDLRDATGSLFHGCRMRGVSLDRAHLSGTTFYQCDLTAARIRDTNLQGSTVNECLLDEADLSGAMVDQLTVTKSSMRETSLSAAHGSDCSLQRLTGSDGLCLKGASLPHLRIGGARGKGWRAAGLVATGGDFSDLSVEDADFSHADLSAARLHRCSLPRVKLTAAILNTAQVTYSSLRGADLVGARAENLQLIESDLAEVDASMLAGRCLVARDTDMTGILLINANLYRAMLTGDPPAAMSLRNAQLQGAVLVQAYLAADMRNADLLNVNAAYSRFSQSSLRGAQLNRANLHQSTWVKVDVTGACLDGVKAPVFADRCPGLDGATAASTDGDSSDLGEFASRLHLLLTSFRCGST